MCLCVCKCVYMYVCLYVCKCVYLLVMSIGISGYTGLAVSDVQQQIETSESIVGSM